MRRQSDICDQPRTGQGRRARDRLLGGGLQATPAAAAGLSPSERENLLLFVADDLRESALAVGGIEAFLLRAQRLLESEGARPEDFAALLELDLEDRVQSLDDALSALRRSMTELGSRL